MADATSGTAAPKGKTPSKGRATPKAKERDQASQAAAYKAKLQWYAIAAVLIIAIVAAIILLSVYTEGELGR